MAIDVQTLQLGALIALLDKYYPSAGLEQRVLDGIKKAKSILDKSDVAAIGGDSVAIAALRAQIDITAQTLTELAINVVAQNVGVYLQQAWAAKEGTDKVISAEEETGADPFNSSVSAYYTVPAGKTLYVVEASSALLPYGRAAADRDKRRPCLLYIAYGSTVLLALGGNDGVDHSFQTPAVVPSGSEVAFATFNFTQDHCDTFITARGFEVDS
jgi:hypothetical protein